MIPRETKEAVCKVQNVLLKPLTLDLVYTNKTNENENAWQHARRVKHTLKRNTANTAAGAHMSETLSHEPTEFVSI